MSEVAGVPPELSALSEAIPAPYGTVKNWHARGNVPVDVVKQFARDYKVSIDRLIGDISAHFEPKNFTQTGLQVTQPDFVVTQGDKVLVAQIKPTHASLKDVVAEVLDALDRNGLELSNEKVGQLVELIYDYEKAAPVTAVRSTTERFLKLVGS